MSTTQIDEYSLKFDMGAFLKKTQFGNLIQSLLIPSLGILIFLLLWHVLAPKVVTSLGAVPGPIQVYGQFSALVDECKEEKIKETAFYERQDQRNAKKLEKDPNAKIKVRAYTGNPTFFSQILTRLWLVS